MGFDLHILHKGSHLIRDTILVVFDMPNPYKDKSDMPNPYKDKSLLGQSPHKGYCTSGVRYAKSLSDLGQVASFFQTKPQLRDRFMPVLTVSTESTISTVSTSSG